MNFFYFETKKKQKIKLQAHKKSSDDNSDDVDNGDESLLGNLDDAILSLDELTDTKLVESFDLADYVELDDLQIFEMFKVGMN